MVVICTVYILSKIIRLYCYRETIIILFFIRIFTYIIIDNGCSYYELFFQLYVLFTMCEYVRHRLARPSRKREVSNISLLFCVRAIIPRRVYNVMQKRIHTYSIKLIVQSRPEGRKITFDIIYYKGLIIITSRYTPMSGASC